MEEIVANEGTDYATYKPESNVCTRTELYLQI